MSEENFQSVVDLIDRRGNKLSKYAATVWICYSGFYSDEKDLNSVKICWTVEVGEENYVTRNEFKHIISSLEGLYRCKPGQLREALDKSVLELRERDEIELLSDSDYHSLDLFHKFSDVIYQAGEPDESRMSVGRLQRWMAISGVADFVNLNFETAIENLFKKIENIAKERNVTKFKAFLSAMRDDLKIDVYVADWCLSSAYMHTHCFDEK